MTQVATENASAILARCQVDPLFFSRHVLGGGQPWEKQVEIMQSVLVNWRTAVPSGFAVGKTWTAARIALWFLFSHPRSLVITTAPTWRQVEHVLWAEIRRQHRESKTPLGGDVLRTQIKIADDWFALGLSTDDPTRFQGFHAAHLLLIFDEAAGVDRTVWDAAEGQMAGPHARWLAISNPIAPSGPFYDVCAGELWHTIQISCLDTPNVRRRRPLYPNLVSWQWVEDRRREWGEQSPLYESRVLGRFPVASEHGLIPLQWVLDANDRAGAPVSEPPSGRQRVVGVDVARSGADATVFLLREDDAVTEIEEHRGLSTMETAGRLQIFVDERQVPWSNVCVDEIGIGAGVVDVLRERRRAVRAVNFGRSARDKARYANLRAECHWRLREAMRPDTEKPLRIPERYGRLCADLVSIEWSVNSSGRIVVEPKEKIKARIGRSPDHSDALALTYVQSAPRTHARLVMPRSPSRVFPPFPRRVFTHRGGL